MKRAHLSLGLALAAGLSGPAAALESDRKQPIYIEADRVEIDDQKGVSVYRGNVQLTQGSMVLNAATVTTYHTPSHTLTKAVAQGSPARFRERPSENAEEIHAEAPRMEYVADKQVIYLLDGGTVTQGGNTFKGQTIEYDITKDVIRAQGGPASGARVRATIQPREKGKPEGGGN